ncbi:MAG TPA: type II toxin-antitoxin system prevent-host-death family antitoxin [Steroidobacteraceae bacterium]|nr:type II toxin-antitoxin system prevent-host-death family antitoxin [Steroidobacteraceae bacterium]
MSSREFGQDPSRAKRAARKGPVYITDQGRPTYVLLTISDYQKLRGGPKSLAGVLHMPRAADVEFMAPKMHW